MGVKLFHKLYPKADSDRYLIILHGLFGMLDNWHIMAKKLSEHINVITVDQRNHGHSPHTEQMDFESMAADLEQLLDELEIEKAVICGHSMGGKVAMVFTDLHPDRVEKLIVVDIAPRAYQGGHEVYFRAFNSIDFSIFQRRSEADSALAKIEPHPSVRQFLLKNLERGETGFKLKFNLKPIEDFYPEMIDGLEFNWLISAPSLFVYGGRSGYVTETDRDEIADRFTEVDFVEIPDAGHWVHAEAPEPFYQAVHSFIAQ